LVRLIIDTSCVPDNSIETKIKALCGASYIDVNGEKGPNQYGRDLYYFKISSDGILYPWGGKDIQVYESYFGGSASYWKNVGLACGTSGSTDIKFHAGKHCAGRVIDEGWEMNY